LYLNEYYKLLTISGWALAQKCPTLDFVIWPFFEFLDASQNYIKQCNTVDWLINWLIDWLITNFNSQHLAKLFFRTGVHICKKNNMHYTYIQCTIAKYVHMTNTKANTNFKYPNKCVHKFSQKLEAREMVMSSTM